MKNKELLIKILILIILLILVFITSFRTGTKFYLLKTTILENSTGNAKSEVARWNFRARIIMNNEVIYDEVYKENNNY